MCIMYSLALCTFINEPYPPASLGRPRDHQSIRSGKRGREVPVSPGTPATSSAEGAREGPLRVGYLCRGFVTFTSFVGVRRS